MDRRKAHERDLLKRILEIDRAGLIGAGCAVLRPVPAGGRAKRVPATLPGRDWFRSADSPCLTNGCPCRQMDGVHIDIPELPRLAPLRTTKDYDDFLSRLAAYPRQVDQVIELMKRGMASGWVPPAVPMRKVLPQIEKQWAEDLTKGPLYKPFENFPDEIAEADRSRLEAQVRELIAGSIIPALKRLHQFIAQTYLPACRQDISASGLPGGAALLRVTGPLA